MVVRSDQEAVVINLDIEPVERPEAVLGGIDPTALAALKIEHHSRLTADQSETYSRRSGAFADSFGLGQQRRVTERRLNAAEVEVAQPPRGETMVTRLTGTRNLDLGSVEPPFGYPTLAEAERIRKRA